MTAEELEAAIDADPEVLRAAVRVVNANRAYDAACIASDAEGFSKAEQHERDEACSVANRVSVEADNAYDAARKAARDRLQPKPVTLRAMALGVIAAYADHESAPSAALARAAIAYFDKTEKELVELRQEKADQAQANDRWAMTVVRLSERHRLKSDELLDLQKMVVNAWLTANWNEVFDVAQRFKKEGVQP